MKQKIGIALIAIGVIALLLPFIPFTTEETVVDIGPLTATAEQEKTIDIPLIVGGLILAGGIVLVALDKK